MCVHILLKDHNSRNGHEAYQHLQSKCNRTNRRLFGACYTNLKVLKDLPQSILYVTTKVHTMLIILMASYCQPQRLLTGPYLKRIFRWWNLARREMVCLKCQDVGWLQERISIHRSTIDILLLGFAIQPQIKGGTRQMLHAISTARPFTGGGYQPIAIYLSTLKNVMHSSNGLTMESREPGASGRAKHWNRSGCPFPHW